MNTTDARVGVAGRWTPTGSALPRLFVGGGLLVAGVLTGRFDVAVLGVPLVLSVVLGLLRRPEGRLEVCLGRPRYGEQAGTIAATLRIDAAAAAAGTLGPGPVTARLRVATPGFRDREVLVDAAADRQLELSVRTVRTGRQQLFRVDHQFRGAHAVLRAPNDWVGPVSLVVLPRPSLLGPVPLPHRLQGLTGSHRSVRAGDGGEFRDLAEFAPGDRLRRIDWKATARRGSGQGGPGTGTTLFVRRTFATADAHVMLVFDARDEVGPDVAGWDFGRVLPDEATSLDLARRAGTSLARRYLDQGDRVGLAELGRPRWLRPAGGRRQLTQIVHHLATAEPDGEPAQTVTVPHLPSGVLVVVLSTFLDDVPVGLAVDWRFTGHRVLAVDVLPQPTLAYLGPRQLTAHRLVALERDERLAALTAAGVEVVRWDHAGDGARVEASLATLARTRRAGR